MSYVPVARSQYQPRTATSDDDCVAAACAEAVERCTVGAVQVSHAAIRKASGQASGGLSYPNAVAATLKLTGIRGEVRYGILPGDLKALLKAGRSVTISINTSVTHGTSCGTYNFIGGHSLFINSWDQVANYYLDDPGTTSVGFHNCPTKLIDTAALLRSGERGINVIVWPDTEGVSWKAIRSHGLRSLPSYTKGAAMGVTKAGTTYVGGRTQNGDPYKLPDGRTTNGWVHVKVGGKWLWTIGHTFHG